MHVFVCMFMVYVWMFPLPSLLYGDYCTQPQSTATSTVAVLKKKRKKKKPKLDLWASSLKCVYISGCLDVQY